jgi:hypothetical protein
MTAHPSLIDALDDPQLFGGMFDDASWDRWIVFLRALQGLPLDPADLAIFQHHTGRSIPPTAPSRYAELVVGRRGGKSRILALVATYLACVPDHDPFIVPGETPVVAIIARDRQQAAVIKNYLAGFIRAVPAFADMIVDELAESIRLTNRVVVEVHTASIAAPRGRTFLAVLCDETAFWPNGDSTNPDVEVINAVRPGLSTIPYSLLLVASSPYAKRGILYTNYAKYFGKDDAPVLVWQGSTPEMNSTQVDDPVAAAMYEEDPERAAAEYGALFRTDIVAFITREAVEDVVARGVREVPPGGGIAYCAFVDPSGGSADSFTMAIAHLEPDGTAFLDCIREVKPPFSPDAVVQEFAATLKSYGISRVIGDAYAGMWPRERFAVHGITYEVSARNKSAIYGEFLPALNGRRVRLLDIPRLTGQLVTLERRTARGGKDSIDHADGQHDDVANAACGVLVQVIEDRRPTLVPAAALRADEEAAPAGLGNVLFCFAVLWIDMSGMAAFAIFARRQPYPEPQLLICDYGVEPWSAGLLDVLARRLGDACDMARAGDRRCRERGVAAMLFAPQQLEGAAANAMRQMAMSLPVPVTSPMIVETIDERFLADPVRMLFQTSAHVTGGKVKLSAAATAMSATVPILGALSLVPGTKVEDDPLRVATMLGITMGLGGLPAKNAHGARTTFN